MAKTILLLFAFCVFQVCNAQSSSTNPATNGLSGFQQQDTSVWVVNLNELRNALYLKDKAKAKKFVVFPLLPDGSDLWYAACGADEKIFSKRECTAFNEKDFDEFFFRLFPREFVRCFLKIKVQELYSKGKSQSPEIKEGRNTYRLYVSYDRQSSYLELNYATNIPVKVSDSEYDHGESNLIYLFRVTEKGHIELVKVLIAG